MAAKAGSTRTDKMAFRVQEFCDAIGLSRSSFYNLVKAGKLKTVVIGGRRLVPASEIARLLSEQP